jgi:parallel beta-helix repeat protein
MKKNLYSIRRLAIGFTAMALAFAPACAWAKRIVVHPGDVIQKAVDLAEPGDIIHIKPGVYTGTAGDEAVVTIKKSGITIRGSTDAVIDASGFEYGILVGEDAELTADGCPPVTVKGFNIQGFTFRNAEDTALKLVGVDGFSITRGVYLDNKEYGPFPVCSQNGLIAKNFASGHGDAAIYVGNDDRVVVRNNTATHSLIGVEIENSADCIVHDNHVSGNTGGILVVALPGLPKPFTKNVLIRNNEVVENNYFLSESEIDLLPVGPASSTSAVTMSRYATTKSSVTIPLALP